MDKKLVKCFDTLYSHAVKQLLFDCKYKVIAGKNQKITVFILILPFDICPGLSDAIYLQ